MKPQSRDVLTLLERGPVTQQDAIREVACYRLAARIADLRAEGYPIVAESVTQNGARFARYRLVTAPVQEALW
jgi:hypothetical protein